MRPLRNDMSRLLLWIAGLCTLLLVAGVGLLLTSTAASSPTTLPLNSLPTIPGHSASWSGGAVPTLDWPAARNARYSPLNVGGPDVPDANALREGLNPAGALSGFQSSSQAIPPMLHPLATPVPYQLKQTLPPLPTLPNVKIGDVSVR